MEKLIFLGVILACTILRIHGETGPCAQALLALDATSPPPGAHRPQCDDQGYYQWKQCSSSSGHCHCVNRNTGEKVPDSQRREWEEGTLDCDPGNVLRRPLGPCENESALLTGVAGAFVPKCSKYGYYSPKQCDYTGKCWCVRPESGIKIRGASGEKTTQPLNCGQCLQALADAMRVGIHGHLYQRCDDDGRFEPVQSKGGLSWCVHPDTGAEYNSSRIRTGDGEPNCDAAINGTDVPIGPCTRKASMPAGTAGKPTCTTDGYFIPVQSEASTAKLYCVHPVSGRTLMADANTSAASCGPCIDALAVFRSQPVELNAVEPVCNAQGNYRRLQYNPRTGKAWCVNLDGTMITVTPPKDLVLTETSEPNCGDGTYQEYTIVKGPCKEEMESLPAGTDYVPQCTQQGFYTVRQVDTKLSKTWCVNPIDGMEVHETRTHLNETKVECGKCHSQLETDLIVPLALGAQLPRCDWRGNYSPAQVKNGERYCVDTFTGVETANTKLGVNDAGSILTCAQ